VSGRLDGQGAIVTGCASGIGLAITRRFLEEGAFVVGIYLDPHASDVVASARFELVEGSVAEGSTFDAALGAAVSRTGGADILVNNAGIQIERTIDTMSVEQFEQVLAVNLRGVFLGIKHAAQRMGAGGRIVNLGSSLGITGDALLAVYSASKAAVINLTSSAAAAYGPRGIRVNCICPGAVRTGLVMRMWELSDDPDAARRAMEDGYPLGRIVEPDEVASTALFLASEESSAITGAALVVDCGLTSASGVYALIKDQL
jgi:NAD(P)-dependent dehydrogenase (short-subunit alcohol dehydrogenase family)